MLIFWCLYSFLLRHCGRLLLLDPPRCKQWRLLNTGITTNWYFPNAKPPAVRVSSTLYQSFCISRHGPGFWIDHFAARWPFADGSTRSCILSCGKAVIRSLNLSIVAICYWSVVKPIISLDGRNHHQVFSEPATAGKTAAKVPSSPPRNLLCTYLAPVTEMIVCHFDRFINLCSL